MGSPVKTYQTEMHENLGLYATWLPTDPMEVGDIGFFEGGRFRLVKKLSDFNIVCDTKAQSGASDLQFSSRDGVKVNISSNISASASTGAQINIDFSSNGAFLFHAYGVRLHRLENRHEVAESVLKLYANNQWEKEWMIVEAVHVAQRATVLISEDKSASVQIAASARMAMPSLLLADPAIDLKVTSFRGKVFQMLSAKQPHPLYACLRVKNPMLGRPKVMPVRGGRDVTPLLERPAIAELLDS